MTPETTSLVLADALTEALGPEKVITDSEELKPYRNGKSPFRELVPGIAVKAASVDDVVAAFGVAREHLAPVVSRGGGFSISGTPSRPGDEPIVLDTRAMDRIVEIDEENMTVTAECGVIMSDLEAAVAERGFEVHTVAIPRWYTTLGGVLSGVCGGGFPSDTAAIGPSGQFLLGLRVVLPNGSVLDTNAGGSNVNRASSSIPVSDGPHITQLFVGDGGALGVKVQATLAIHPARTEVKAGGYFFDTFEAAWAAVTELNHRPDELPYAKLYVTKATPWTLTYAVKAGSPEMLEHNVGVIERTLERHGGTPGDAELLESAQAIADLKIEWANQFIEIDRGAVAVVFGNREFPAAFARLRRLVEQEFAERLEQLGIEPIVFVSPYGRHGTWFGISLPYDPAQPGVRDAVAAMTREGYELVTDLGGYSEPHQGENSNILATAWSPAYRAFFNVLKDGVDPDMTLNAGLWDRA